MKIAELLSLEVYIFTFKCMHISVRHVSCSRSNIMAGLKTIIFVFFVFNAADENLILKLFCVL